MPCRSVSPCARLVNIVRCIFAPVNKLLAPFSPAREHVSRRRACDLRERHFLPVGITLPAPGAFPATISFAGSNRAVTAARVPALAPWFVARAPHRIALYAVRAGAPPYLLVRYSALGLNDNLPAVRRRYGFIRDLVSSTNMT